MSLIDDATLLKMAEAEILEDAKKAAVRHSVAGISGWQPCPKPNKVFLANTILQTMTRNRVLSLKGKNTSGKQRSSKRKLIKKDEKINITFQPPKKEEKHHDISRGKSDGKIKSGVATSNKLSELNNKFNRERLKTKRLKL